MKKVSSLQELLSIRIPEGERCIVGVPLKVWINGILEKKICSYGLNSRSEAIMQRYANGGFSKNDLELEI